MMEIAIIGLVIQVAAVVALVWTVIVYGRQLGTMQKQLDVSQNASAAQNLLSVINLLGQDDAVAARRHLFEIEDAKKAFKEWDGRDRRMASRVCSAYDAVAILIREGLVERKPIVENWGASIRRCYAIVEPHVTSMRETMADQAYWDDFEWLSREAATGTG